MAFTTAKIGTTLNQRALAVHFDRSTSWVRSRGELITGFANYRGRAQQETWARMEYSTKRPAGYRRVV